MSIKVVVCGEGGVGKTAITTLFVKRIFNPWEESEEEQEKILEVDGNCVKLQITDVYFQQGHGSTETQSLMKGEAFLVVYNVCDKKSFQYAQRLRKIILIHHNHDETTPMVMIGNKIDLDSDRTVSENEGREYAKSISVPYFETSAVEFINIDESFIELVREVKKKKDSSLVTSNNHITTNNIINDVHQKQDKESRCSLQ